MKAALWPYKTGSNSAEELANALQIHRIKRENSKYKGWSKRDRVIFNWGSSDCPDHNNVFNPVGLVRCYGNKLASFESFQKAGKEGPRTPEWTTDPEVAKVWRREGYLVVCRGSLTGHSGAGISIAETGLDIPAVPLYTRYVKKSSEFRIHFCKVSQDESDAFYMQRKVKRTDFEGEPNFKVRSHENGFIYQHDNIVVPEDVVEQAAKAFRCSGLDFGAVDVIFNNKHDKAYVLEINTAPGLQGLSVQKYAEAFTRHLLSGRSVMASKPFAQEEEENDPYEGDDED